MPDNSELAIHLFLQLAVILVVCRVSGFVFRYLGQTQVVSEMIAGVLLGPSLFGMIAPDLQKWLFPLKLTLPNTATTITHPSMTIVFILSQLGLVLYMFLIGLQFNTKHISEHFRYAGTISLSGVIPPMLLGGALGVALSKNPDIFLNNIAQWQAALFMGSAMSITAFPMLARIIYENGISHTKIGTLAIGAAAFDDAAAWSLLAVVLATTKNNPMIAVGAIGGGLVYALIMILIGRKVFRRWFRVDPQNNNVPVETLALLMLVLMLCAWYTDVVGIYSIFGAFIAGTVMPRGKFADGVRDAIENLTVSLLLPTFFIFSGLNTRIDLLLNPSVFGMAILIIAVAFISKGGGCLLATRWGGASWREAAIVGVLMNARGLMELILINIGLQKGLISQSLFTILVLMAILTTVVASPLFNYLYKEFREPAI